jgi:poly(A) polymerase
MTFHGSFQRHALVGGSQQRVFGILHMCLCSPGTRAQAVSASAGKHLGDDFTSPRSSSRKTKRRSAHGRRRPAPGTDTKQKYDATVADFRDSVVGDLYQKNRTSVLDIGSTRKYSTLSSATTKESDRAIILEDCDHSIMDCDISPAAWFVLHKLRKEGHENYLVGGTVRDLLMQRVPKDFDVLTSAEPEHIVRIFPKKSWLLGKRFPICHVHHAGEIIEVSSFVTSSGSSGDQIQIPMDFAALSLPKSAQIPRISPRVTWSEARKQNARKRDFTMNALLYDPFSRILFDYVGGIDDCMNNKLKTIGSVKDSFVEDPARILRAIRLASRLELKIDDEMKDERLNQRATIGQLPQGRLQMELHSLIAYGSGSTCFELLKEYRVFEILLPHHFEMIQRDATMATLMSKIVSEMDSYASVEAPITTALWTGLLFSLLCYDTITTYGGAQNQEHFCALVDETAARILCTTNNQCYHQLLARGHIERTSAILKKHIVGSGVSTAKNRSSRKQHEHLLMAILRKHIPFDEFQFQQK